VEHWICPDCGESYHSASVAVVMEAGYAHTCPEPLTKLVHASRELLERAERAERRLHIAYAGIQGARELGTNKRLDFSWEFLNFDEWLTNLDERPYWTDSRPLDFAPGSIGGGGAASGNSNVGGGGGTHWQVDPKP